MKWMLAVAMVAAMAASPARSAPVGPSTRPAPAPQANEDPRPRVLVMPFEELAEGPSRDWIGKAMQQSLVAELTRSGLVSALTPAADAPPASDAASAAKLARDLHAPLVITGSYQLIDQELRVTGQMLESIDGESIAAIKATGSLRDLFGIQDTIGEQVRRDLQAILQPPPVAGADRQRSARAAHDPFAIDPSGPVRRPAPTGAYNGSDLQRSLGDEWSPPPSPQVAEGRDRYRYDYPVPPYAYHPMYSYYDWCGYNYPLVPRGSYAPGYRVVPPGPGPTRTDFPQNNYITQPGQMGRPSGNNNYNNHPGQMGRSSGNTNYNNPPGQSGRSSGGNQIGSSGQSGRTTSPGSSSASRSRSIPGSSGNASRSVGSTSGDASRP